MKGLDETLKERQQLRQTPTTPNKTRLASFMDDTGAVTPFEDIAFTFAYIDAFGPHYGLYLNKTKNQIILATNGIDPLPHIQPQLANDIRQVAHDFCNNKICLNGTVLLGTPIGNPQFVQQYLDTKLSELKSKIHYLQKHVDSPATKMRLFHGSLQLMPLFQQFIDGVHFINFNEDDEQPSSFNTALTSLYQAFLAHLCNLNPHDTLPPHCWPLATRPLSAGGFGFLDPHSNAPIHFIRPLLRTITAAHEGIRIKTPHSSDTNDYITFKLPDNITLPFRQWQSSTLPWIQKWANIIDPFLQHDNPNHALSTIFTQHVDPFLILKKANNELTKNKILTTTFSQDIITILPTLTNPLTSQALVTIPLSLASNRIPASTYFIAMRRKLRIPITEQSTCRCGSKMDQHCDHAFKCTHCSKTLFHNRTRDTLAYVLSHIVPHSSLAYTSNDVAREPTNLLPRYPNLRPADVAIKLANQQHTHLLIDVTCISMPTQKQRDPNPLTVTLHHERHENSKFRRPNDKQPQQILQNILDRQFLLLPFTVDPGGCLGPMATSFFWRKHPRYPSLLRPSSYATRPKQHLNLPQAELLCKQTLDNSPQAILSSADQGWKDAHGDAYFTNNHKTPSIWATQTLGHNLNLALSLHIQEMLSNLHPFSKTGSNNSTLLTAASKPHLKPTHPFTLVARNHLYLTATI
jgi:hypothetical protein